MKRIALLMILTMAANFAPNVSFAQEETQPQNAKIKLQTEKKKQKKIRLRSNENTRKSIELKRLQRTPSGKVDATQLTNQLKAEKRKAGQFRSPKLSEMANQNKPSTKLNPASTTKRFGQRLELTKSTQSPRKSIELKRLQRTPSGKLNSTNLTKQLAEQKRHAGKFRSPKLSEMANSKRPSTKLNPSATTKRFAGKFQSPKSLTPGNRPKTTTLTQKAPGRSKSKFPAKKIGKGLGGLAVAGVGASTVDNMKNAKEEYRKGNLSKSQYKKEKKKTLTNAAGELYKIKKLNPSAIVLNDVIGTDPVSLGVDAVLDVVNGTDNAKQSLKNVKQSWNNSLTKQAFTDPKAAGERVKKGAKKFGNKVKDGSKKVGEFFKDKFKSKKKKKKKK